MVNKLVPKIFLYLSAASVAFIAVYSLFIDYKFSGDLLNYFFSLFYLVLSLSFIINIPDSARREERLNRLFKCPENIFFYCILSGSFSVIFIGSGLTCFRTALIILTSLVLFNVSLYILSRRTSLILFWINLYLFAGMTALSHLTHLNIDLVSKYNPFGGLLITLFT